MLDFVRSVWQESWYQVGCNRAHRYANAGDIRMNGWYVVSFLGCTVSLAEAQMEHDVNLPLVF